MRGVREVREVRWEVKVKWMYDRWGRLCRGFGIVMIRDS